MQIKCKLDANQMQVECKLNVSSEIVLVLSRVAEVVSRLMRPDWLDVLKNEASV